MKNKVAGGVVFVTHVERDEQPISKIVSLFFRRGEEGAADESHDLFRDYGKTAMVNHEATC